MTAFSNGVMSSIQPLLGGFYLSENGKINEIDFI